MQIYLRGEEGSIFQVDVVNIYGWDELLEPPYSDQDFMLTINEKLREQRVTDPSQAVEMIGKYCPKYFSVKPTICIGKRSDFSMRPRRRLSKE